MRIPLAFLFVFLFFTSLAHQLTEIDNFGSNPGNLKMYYYRPAHLDTTKEIPMVIVLHGCLQSAEAVSEISGWNKMADLNGFCILYPQQKYTNNYSGCFDWFKKKDVSKGRGEVASIKEMLDYMVTHKGVDKKQVFVSGLSAGAAMAVALMACYPESIQAGAIFAGGPYKVAKSAFQAMFVLWIPPNKSPKRWAKLVIQQNPSYSGPYPRLIAVHGRLDYAVNFHHSWELIQQWSFLHQTDPKADKIEDGFANVKDVCRLGFNDAKGKEVIVFYKIKNLSHALAIDPGNQSNQGGKEAAFSVDKNFHSTYWVAKDFGLVR